MIRILHYIGSLKQGGSQAMIMNLYKGIDRSKIQFDFVIHADGITPLALEAQKMGATIYTCPSYSARTAKAYKKWWNDFFKAHTEYKIIHSHVRSTAAIVLKIAKRYGLKTIAHSHSTSSGSGISAVVKSLLQYRIRYVADYFMGCSQAAGEWLFGKKVCESDVYFNVPNAINIEKYTYDPRKAELKRIELGYTTKDIVIGHVGRFSEPKNHDFLIDIFAELHKKDKKYKLLLIGDGELRSEIESKVKRLGLCDFVQFTGTRADVAELMMAMDLFLFPSKWEGLPVSVIEAQTAGLPCIISANITGEVCISPLVKQEDLSAPVSTWLEDIVVALNEGRKDVSGIVKATNYDIQKSVAWMTDFYERIENNE